MWKNPLLYITIYCVAFAFLMCLSKCYELKITCHLLRVVLYFSFQIEMDPGPGGLKGQPENETREASEHMARYCIDRIFIKTAHPGAPVFFPLDMYLVSGVGFPLRRKFQPQILDPPKELLRYLPSSPAQSQVSAKSLNRNCSWSPVLVFTVEK